MRINRLAMMMFGCCAALLFGATTVRAAEPDPRRPGMEAEKPPGPAKKMKVLKFVYLSTVCILELRFLDANDKPTKAPKEGETNGEITWTSNVPAVKTGKLAVTDTEWKADNKKYAFSKLPGYQKLCPPHTGTLKAVFKLGKTTFTANWSEKIPCTKP